MSPAPAERTGARGAPPAVLQHVAKGLRRSAATLTERADRLDARTVEEQELLAALTASPVLTERQKRVLRDIYDSFRRANDGAAPPPPPGPGYATRPPAR